MAHGQHSPLDHVVDHATLELPGLGWEFHLPAFGNFQLTRFMVMELLAAALVAVVVVPLARHAANNRVTRGRFMNLFEAIVLFVRDGIARPAIGGSHGHERDHAAGHHDAAHATAHHAGPTADDFLPYLLTVFFFVLFCNLLGMLPGCASATGNINVTGALALLTFLMVLFAGMRASGPVKFWVNLVPPLDVPIWLKPILWVLMLVIEVFSLLVKHIVLSIRLFANMLAGHIVIAVIMGFILMAAGYVRYFVIPASIGGVVAISLLELVVAFLQAYIFTFLSALFIGQAVHPH